MNSAVETSAQWFCLRSQPKHEHVAAAQLAEEPDIEVYLPRIRFRRPTRQGPKWFTEALFPNYLFARFELATSLRKVKSSRGVRDVVHFGERWPAVPDAAMHELRAAISGDQIHVISAELQPGEVVQIAGGAFHGLQAVVTRALSGQERVSVLLEFLGTQTTLDVSSATLIRQIEPRAGVICR